ncbi:MAG: cell division protein ZapA [Xanthobacteraceae bacterium]
MAQVVVTINGRQFRMACEDGQEEHLTRLAHDFDQRIGELRAKFGEIGDTRLTVMAALTIADQLFEAVIRIRKLEAELAAREGAQLAAADRDRGTDQTVISALNSAAERIETLTRELNHSLGENVVLG